MSRAFVDTSALIALLNADDRQHARARSVWTRLLDDGAHMWTSNYNVMEATAVVQRQAGLDALAALHGVLLPVIHVEWVHPSDHASALAAVRAARRRDLSLVDCTSFELMRRLGIDTAFAFDPHFAEHGFRTVP